MGMTREELWTAYSAGCASGKQENGFAAIAAEAEKRGREAERDRIAAGLAAHGWCSQRIAEAMSVLGEVSR